MRRAETNELSDKTEEERRKRRRDFFSQEMSDRSVSGRKKFFLHSDTTQGNSLTVKTLIKVSPLKLLRRYGHTVPLMREEELLVLSN